MFFLPSPFGRGVGGEGERNTTQVNMGTIINKYKCSQSALYSLCRLAWANCQNQLARFTAFKPFYDAPFITARIAEVTAAEDLPHEQARDEASETAHINLHRQAEICLGKWRELKRYIITAFPDMEKPKLESAGSEFYDKAQQMNWEEVQALMNAGENFITTHSVDLSAGNNMPVGFPPSFSSSKTNFETVYAQALLEEENQSLATDEKITANNDLQDKVMLMLLDGQVIFQNEESMQQLFIYNHLLEMVTRRVANCKGRVSTGIANAPVEGCRIFIPELDHFADSDNEGRYDFGRLAAGTYTLKVSKDGFEEQTHTDVEVSTGTTITRDFSLVPSAAPPVL